MSAAAPDELWSPSSVQVERDAYRRSRSVRSVLIALGSTVVVLAGLVFAVGSSPGWPRVQQSFFDPNKAIASLPAVLDGLWLNVRAMLICAVLIGALGLLLAVMRTLSGPIMFPFRLFATIYVDLFRGLPLLLVILLLGYGAPALQLQGLPNSALFWAGAALVLTYSAYVAEVFRAGIESIHPSQRAAARVLGLNSWQTLRFVVLPQAVRRVLPALMNDVVALQKDTGLLAAVGVVDAVMAARIETSKDFNFTPYVVAGLLFICLTVPMARFTDAFARRRGLASPQGV